VPPRGDAVEHAAQRPVLGGDDVAVDQDDRRALAAALEVVEADAVDVEEAPDGVVGQFELLL